MSKPKKFEGQITTIIIQSASQSCDAEGLTGGSSDKKVNWPILICSNRRKITVQGNVWIMMCQNGPWRCVNLTKKCWLPAKMMPSYSCSLNAAANAAITDQGITNAIAIRVTGSKPTIASKPMRSDMGWVFQRVKILRIIIMVFTPVVEAVALGAIVSPAVGLGFSITAP